MSFEFLKDTTYPLLLAKIVLAKGQFVAITGVPVLTLNITVPEAKPISDKEGATKISATDNKISSYTVFKRC